MMAGQAVKFRVFVEGQAVGDVWHHGELSARAVSRTIVEMDELAREAVGLGLDVRFVRLARAGRDWVENGSRQKVSGRALV